MRFLIVSLLVSCSFPLFAEMQNGRLRFEESDTLVQTGNTVFFPARAIQKSGDYLVIEGEDFSSYAPTDGAKRLLSLPDASNGWAVSNARQLSYDFTIENPGEYQVWLRAKFPLRANYNHNEKMDDGVLLRTLDSLDPSKVSKADASGDQLYQLSNFLQPGCWHWVKNHTYDLSRGEHHWEWPSPDAWCGGCLLDKIVLIRKGSMIKPEEAGTDNRILQIAKNGSLLSRRIRIARIAAWEFEFTAEPGDGKIFVEYSYDGERFQPVKNGEKYVIGTAQGEYLWFRIRMENAPDRKHAMPILYHYAFRFEKKPKEVLKP